MSRRVIGSPGRAVIDERPWRDWDELEADEQRSLREAYGRYLDSLPTTCDLDEKVGRFRHWLVSHQIRYRPATGTR